MLNFRKENETNKGTVDDEDSSQFWWGLCVTSPKDSHNLLYDISLLDSGRTPYFYDEFIFIVMNVRK